MIANSRARSKGALDIGFQSTAVGFVSRGTRLTGFGIAVCLLLETWCSKVSTC